MARRTINTVILVVLIAGAVLFIMLLAGVGSEALTNPAAYHPPGG